MNSYISTSTSRHLESEKLKQMRDQFVQNVSHELRTPVAIIRGYAELLDSGDLGSLSGEQKKIMQVITRQTHHLTRMVTRIGLLLAIDAHTELQMPLRVEDLLVSLVEEYQDEARVSGLTLDYDVTSDGPFLAVGDEYQLSEALAGLIENAIKFTEEDGRITVRVYRQDGMINLEVEDTGIGIPGEELQAIFEDFYQVDGSTTRRYGGLGVGLTLARRVAESQGGHMEVESEVERGSKFRICLPELEEAGDREEPATKSWRILIVDDEKVVADMLRAALQKMPNFKVSVANDGASALRLLAEKRFDLMITDYRMPGIDGMSLSEKARQKYPWIAIIMVTAHDSYELRKQASGSAVKKILSKPVRLAEIREVAADALAQAPVEL